MDFILKWYTNWHGNSLVDENGIYYANGKSLTDEQFEQANILGKQNVWRVCFYAIY